MILELKDDDGKLICKYQLDSIVGVGFIKNENTNEEAIVNIIEGAGSSDVIYANRFLEELINSKMKSLVAKAMPASEYFL